MTNSTDQLKPVPTWVDFLKADKEYSELEQTSDLARSRQRDCEQIIRSNDMPLRCSSLFMTSLSRKSLILSAWTKKKRLLLQNLLGTASPSNSRNEQLFDYLQELDEQKYALHLAIADASIKRQQYKQEADEADKAQFPIRKRLVAEHNKLEAEAKEAASKKQQEQSK